MTGYDLILHDMKTRYGVENLVKFILAAEYYKADQEESSVFEPVPSQALRFALSRARFNVEQRNKKP